MPMNDPGSVPVMAWQNMVNSAYRQLQAVPSAPHGQGIGDEVGDFFSGLGADAADAAVGGVNAVASLSSAILDNPRIPSRQLPGPG
jgi:hypothetical protein